MADNITLQEAILQEVRREKIPVTLFLMNGFQLRGVITGFDSFVVVLSLVKLLGVDCAIEKDCLTAELNLKELISASVIAVKLPANL